MRDHERRATGPTAQDRPRPGSGRRTPPTHLVGVHVDTRLQHLGVPADAEFTGDPPQVGMRNASDHSTSSIGSKAFRPLRRSARRHPHLMHAVGQVSADPYILQEEGPGVATDVRGHCGTGRSSGRRSGGSSTSAGSGDRAQCGHRLRRRAGDHRRPRQWQRSAQARRTRVKASTSSSRNRAATCSPSSTEPCRRRVRRTAVRRR